MSKHKHAESLAKSYELEEHSKEAFFAYILESLVNGQRQQMRDLFNEMEDNSKEIFLLEYLDPKIGIQKSCLNICILELVRGN